MAQLHPYLHFNGNCREAMEFYQACLGGALDCVTVGESQLAANMPEAMHAHILHSFLKSEHIVLMASDMMGPEGVIKGNTTSLVLVSSDKTEITTLFEKLSAGGTVTHPLVIEFFGTFGDFTDKFGVDWMVQADT